MAKQTRRELYITCNGKEADTVVEALGNHLSKLRQELDKMRKAGQENTKKFNELTNAEKALNKAIKSNVSDTEKIDKVMKNLANSSTRQLRSALSSVRREIERTSASSGKLPQLRKQFEAIKNQIDKNTGAINKHGSSWKTAMKNLTAYVGMFAVFNKAKELITGVIKKNFEYSSSLTDIRKVSGLAMEDVNNLSKELSKINTRTGVQDLAKLAYSGAKLGMGKYGVEGMAGFVRAADQINVAIGEEMGEQALPAMAKMVEVMGLIPKMGIEKSMLATGSALFKLSSTSTATSSNIMEFAKRLTGVARSAGITTDQILALGSAADSMYLMPEVASTAMSKFIVALQKNHNLIAKELGIPDETIKSLYASGHAIDAMVLVLEKMHEKGNLNALGDIFKTLGSNGQRLIGTMVTMSNNVDMLKDHLAESEEAFNDATAVTQEYEMQQKSAAGILERANGLWEKAFVDPDGVDMVRQLAQAWYWASNTILNSPLFSGIMQAPLWTLQLVLRGIVLLLPVFISYLVSVGIVKGITMIGSLVSGFKTFVVTMRTAIAASQGFIAALRAQAVAQSAANAAANANPYVALCTVLVTLVGVVWSLVSAYNAEADAQEKAQTRTERLNMSMREAEGEASQVASRMQFLISVMEKSNVSQNKREQLIKSFNKEFRPYIQNLGLELNTVGALRKNYTKLAEEARKAAYYRMMQKEMAKVNETYDKRTVSVSQDIEAILKDAGVNLHLKDFKTMIKKGGEAAVVDMIAKAWAESKGAKLKNPNGVWNGEDNLLYSANKGNATVATYNFWPLRKKIAEYSRIETHRAEDMKETQDIFYNSGILDKGYTPYQEDVTGTLSNDALDKETLKLQKENAAQEVKEQRDELKDAKDKVQGLISKIEDFFETILNVQKREALELNLDEFETQYYTYKTEKLRASALSNARNAIAGFDNGWVAVRDSLKGIKVDTATELEQSHLQTLLEAINGVDVDALKNMIFNLSSTLKQPYESLRDQIAYNASKNTAQGLSREQKFAFERQDAANRNDPFKKLNKETLDDFSKLGYADVTDDDMRDAVLNVTDDTDGDGSLANEYRMAKASVFKERQQSILQMLENARKNIDEVLSFDVSTEDGRGGLSKLIFGESPDKWMARLKDTLGKSETQWSLFYNKLIDYSDKHTEALKKEEEERGKVNDYLWSISDEKKAVSKKEREANEGKENVGEYKTLGQTFGFQNTVDSDPEVKLYKAKLKAAEAYYDFIEQHGATENQLAAARKDIYAAQKDLVEKITEDTFAQYNTLMTFMQPLNQFTESLGEAFATMTENASEGKKQVKQALKQMIKQFATSSLQMISQQQIDKAKTAMHYQQLLALQQQFGQTRLTAEEIMDNEMRTEKSDSDAASEQQEAQHQTNKTSLQSAGIFGWCVSELGPIAGPIAYAAMMSILMGLLSFALAKVGGSSSSAKTNTKLKSGMLTYDSGNVQELKPFVSDNGELYWASENDTPHKGVNLLTKPTATTINGQKSLVAENGPELVVGRETTKAMMMNNPSLLKALVNYDANYSGRRAYDQGNLAEALGTLTTSNGASDAAINNAAAANAALVQVTKLLLARLSEPISASINMYGTGGIYENTRKANQFMKGKR